MSTFLSIVRSLALLAARLVLGGILLGHGWDRWQLRGIESQAAYLERFGTPYPLYATWGSILLELVGGVFLIAGALTPLVALAVLVEQVLIVSWTNWFTCPYVQGPEVTVTGACEVNAGLAAVALLLTVFGAGSVSVDRLFRRQPRVVEEEPGPRAVPGGSSSRTR